jgi:hypothetical protein
MRIVLLLFFTAMFSGPATAATPVDVVLEASGERTTTVVDPAATAKSTLVVDIGSTISGSHRLKSSATRLEAGRYRMTVFARLSAAADDDLSQLRFNWLVGDGKEPLLKLQHGWTQFDSTLHRYTPLEAEVTFLRPTVPTFELRWQQAAASASEKARPIRKSDPRAVPKFVQSPPKKKSSSLLGGDDDLLADIQGPQKLAAVSTVTYPALLVDRVAFEPLGGPQWIERVRPQFVHVYPNQANPVNVEIRNREDRSVEATVEVELLAGLDETVHKAAQKLTLAPGAATSCRFEWPGSPREFGHEARVTLVVDGKPVQTASDYFSCSFPIWKTALQGSGFLDWYGREKDLPTHVTSNRERYFNVEEAFSWQPSSWTDLNPKTDHWWSGQGDAHNNVEGLQLWIDSSHREGIKMITYLWPTASGPEGIEWGRKAPELVTHGRVGLPTEFFDVEDLRLKSITEADPRLWDLRSGIWNYVGVNRGMLRAVETGVGETIASAKRFGWDGARFDKPPSWSAMSAADMHGEFALLKCEKMIQELVPEYYDEREGTWSEEAVSITNVRYARRRFAEHDPYFATSYNRGFVDREKHADLKFVEACSVDGGQIMDEEIRQLVRGPWKKYFARIQNQADLIRQLGGHHCCVAPSGLANVGRLYTSLAVFLGGSHPYGDFGASQPLPGRYTQFMTRYGEYCWAGELTPTTAEAEAFAIDDDTGLWWRDLVRRRTTADGREQWVVNLLSAPPNEEMQAEKLGPMQPWRRNIAVSRQTAAEPIVWALTAEPTTRAVKLAPKKSGEKFVVEVPEHRVWTMLVWTEATR